MVTPLTAYLSAVNLSRSWLWCVSMAQAFLNQKDAHSILKRFPRANGFLEELRQDNIQRECVEESCSFEEAKEVFENKELTMEFWKKYTESGRRESRSERTETVYMVVPLLGVALLIIIALFLIWRCQLQKATRRRPAYSQNRYLASRQSRSLPRILVHRESPSHLDTSHTEPTVLPRSPAPVLPEPHPPTREPSMSRTPPSLSRLACQEPPLRPPTRK
ncbi:hypothetical protein GJAV_G00135960 [Gymnothorax javanicus]|nr:hypothetical protein GJAV_G00135960 [Gymnothorax javanicus]